MRSKSSYRTGKREAVLRKMAAMRAAKERKRMEGPPPERGPQKVPAGLLLGVIQWHAASGDVHRITVRQGGRANQIRVRGCQRDHGFDWLLRKLRGKLATPRRVIANLAFLLLLTSCSTPSGVRSHWATAAGVWEWDAGTAGRNLNYIKP